METAEEILRRNAKGIINEGRDYEYIELSTAIKSMEEYAQMKVNELNKSDVSGQSELLFDFISFYAERYQMTFTDKFKQELIKEFEKIKQ